MDNPGERRSVEEDFLALLCPQTRQALRPATARELTEWQLEAALVREDRRVAYPVRGGIPVLLAEAAIQIE